MSIRCMNIYSYLLNVISLTYVIKYYMFEMIGE